jgi:hypothetical protein
MKKTSFFSLLFSTLFLLSVPLSLAQDNIVTGNSSSETRVYNSVGDDGQTFTHIETTVNGQTKTIDSKNQGEIDVRNENGKVTINKSPNVTVTITENESATSTPTMIPKEIEIHKISFLSEIEKDLRSFFGRISSIFKD